MPFKIFIISSLVTIIYRLISVLPNLIKAKLLDKINWKVSLDYDENINLMIHSNWSYYRRNACTKEPETVEWLESTLREGDVFLDIGANVGAYSLVAATIMKKGTIICIEPSFSTHRTLCDNILLIQDRYRDIKFIPFCCALSDSVGIIEFNYSETNSGAARHGEDSSNIILRTPALSIDKIITDFKMQHPSVVKIDVDGPELEVIKGATKLLMSAQLRSILIEVTRTNANKIEEILGIHGFTKTFAQKRGDCENRVYSR